MSLRQFRRASGPVAVLSTVTFLSSLLPTRTASAEAAITPTRGGGGASSLASPTGSSDRANGLASVETATGSAQATLPFDLPSARGNAQPSLALSYNSSAGLGFAGVGWTLDLPSIERKGVAGMPAYTDNPSPSGAETSVDDGYQFGRARLVPLCTIDPSWKCNHAPSEQFPTKVAGWTYYRAEVDNGMRFFFSPSRTTWLVQTNDGIELLFGAPLDPPNAEPPALEYADNGAQLRWNATTQVHRWNLARQTDASGNAVHYVWAHLQAVPNEATSILFLTDVYDTAAPKHPGTGSGFDTTGFAHHTHLRWSQPNAWATSMAHTPIWRARPTLQLLGVDVTSAPWTATGPRQLVRRYHLDYTWNATRTRPFLSSFQLEGTCGGIAEDATGQIPAQTQCLRQPATKMAYTQPTTTLSVGSQNYFGSGTALLDVDGDALPEILDFDRTRPGAQIGVAPSPSLRSTSRLGPIGLETTGRGARVATLRDLAPGGQPTVETDRTIYGDWVGDGQLNALWMNIDPQHPANPYPSNNGYELYSVGATGDLTGLGPFPLRTDPQDPNGFDNPGYHPDTNASHGIDIDGDGLVDLGFLRLTLDNTQSFLSRRTPSGRIEPFGLKTKAVCVRVDPLGRPVVAADYDGDGLVDIVRLDEDRSSGSFHSLDGRVFRNRGDGRFGIPGAHPNDCAGGASSEDVLLTSGEIPRAVFDANLVALHDLNGDGLADLVVFRDNHIEIDFHSRDTGGFDNFGAQTARVDLPGGTFDPLTTSLFFGDSDGSGTDELIFDHRVADFVGPTPAGLLYSVSNGFGATTTIQYSSVAKLGTKTPKLPVPAQVVTKTTTTNGLSGAQAQTYVTEYSYGEPIYDPRDRQFLGFRSETEHVPGDAGLSPGNVTTTTFATNACNPGPATTCTPSVDYLYRITRGLPAAIEQFQDDGVTHLTTLLNTFQYRSLYTGIDGRVVRQIWAQKTDLYLWNPIQGVTPTPQQVVFSAEGGQAFSISVAITEKATAHLQRTRALDSIGNEATVVEYGIVGVDTPIRTDRFWDLPAGEASRWQYRKTNETLAYSDMQGINLVGPVRQTYFDYEPRGLLQRVSAPLSGTVTLNRHNDGNAFALPPTDASVDAPNGRVLIASMDYEPMFGNLTRTQRANGRCTDIAYDGDAYAQFPTRTTAYKAGCNSADSLWTERRFDRGFEAVTMERSSALELAMATYDAFGRVIEIDQPDSTTSGMTASFPVLLVDYSKADTGPVRKILTQKIASRDGYSQVWQYVDAFGRNLANVSNTEIPGVWTVSGMTSRATNGRVVRAFDTLFHAQNGGDTFPVEQPSTAASAKYTYDELGRVLTTTDLGGALTSRRQYNVTPTVLSVDIRDGEQLSPTTKHPNAYASIFTDGHGRTKKTVRHVVTNGLDDLTTTTNFNATAQPTSILQSHSASADVSIRALQYDSLGRLVQNIEPNSGIWQYAYNDSGDLVGTADARGCGENLAYDQLGRLIAEDFSPCTDTQALYSQANVSTGEGAEAFYRYDTPEVSVGFEDVAYHGRMTASYDRAQHTQRVLDARGRTVQVRRQLAKPDSAAMLLADRYTPHWFVKSTVFDEGDRPVRSSTGADVAELLSSGQNSYVDTTFTVRGTISGATSSYGDLFSQTINANGSISQRVLKDAAQTTTDYAYFTNGRVRDIHTYRGKGPGPWSTSANYTPPAASDPNTLEQELTHLIFDYDGAGNPTTITDAVDAGSWPTGAKPASLRSMRYDDSYQLTRVDIAYSAGDDAYSSPFHGDASFPVPASSANRVRWQTTDYDWLGNTKASADDAAVFPDRSLGTITNGSANAVGPHRLLSATNGSGRVDAQYDEAGNLTVLTQTRAAPCAPNCSTYYVYDWDELGRIQAAYRVETVGDSLGIVANRTFGYDSGGNRMLKKSFDFTNGASTYGASIFDSLRIDDAAYPDANGDYERTARTESAYLNVGGATVARLVYGAGSSPTGTGQLHVFYELGDQLGSTSFVVDRDTGELVERATYQAYGAAESDFRTDRWGNFRETYRYTGHEDDAEVGLTYYGRRYYSPLIGRWASPDPANIHGFGADPNPYAFTNGSPMRFVDPFGLEGTEGGGGEGTCVGLGCAIEGFVGAIVGSMFGGPRSQTISGTQHTEGFTPEAVWQPPKIFTSGIRQAGSGSTEGTKTERVLAGVTSEAWPAPSWWNPLYYNPISGPYLWALGLLRPTEFIHNNASTEEFQQAATATLGVTTAASVAVGVGPGLLKVGKLATTVLIGGAGKLARAAGILSFEAAEGAAQGARFSSFRTFKAAVGSAGEGMEWHHIVEQTPSNMGRFGPGPIQNTGNLIRVEYGVHRQISGFYSSNLPGGTTVRQWLGSQSFEFQQNFGIGVLRDFGVLP